MVRFTRPGITTLALLGLGLGACTATDDGATVETSGWFVNGLEPTNANCDLFEVGDVRLELVDTFDGFTYEALFDCTEGNRVQVIRDFLPPADYEVYWTAFDLNARDVVDEVRVTPDVSVFSYGDLIVLAEPLFSRPRVEITWDAAGLDCFDAGIDEVELELVPVRGGRRIGPFAVPCSDDGYLFSNVAPGDYLLRIDGFDRGARIYAADCEDIDVPPTNGSYFCAMIPKI